MKTMKSKVLMVLFIHALALALASCTDTPAPVSPPTPVVEKKKVVLAWGESRQEWTDHLIKEIESKTWNDKITNFCNSVPLKECIAQAISIMAKYESNFKPETKYNETGHLQGVVSRGLFQISMDSANQKAYSCGIKKAEDLHDPFINITCMVNIVNYWLNKDLVFFGGDKLGLGRYHHVGRASSKSQAKIMDYLKGVK